MSIYKRFRTLAIGLLIMFTVVALVVAIVPQVTQVAQAQAVACQVAYNNRDDWGSGATIDVTITNSGSTAINGWTLTWTFPGNQQITNLWNGNYSQSGALVSVSNAPWNGTIGANGGTVGFGFNLSYSGSNNPPTDFALNGVACNGSGGPTATPTNTSQPPTATPTNTPQPPTATPTNTPQAPTPTPTNTSQAPTPTPTNTPQVPTPTPTNTPTSGGACSITYANQNDWGSGATINVTITNNSSSTINGWTLTWTFPGNQQITNLWGGNYSQSGASVSVSNAPWNGTISANGGTAGFGFNINYSGSNGVPTDFALNGVSCGGGGGPTPTPTNTPQGPTPTPTNTPQGPTPTPTNTPQGPTPTPTNTPTPPPPGTHLNNPFVGATWYVNPDWAANAVASGGAAVANYNTAVWMDRIGAITAGRGLQGHLDEALSQGANLIIIVIYDLPNRDCAALASNGELLIAEDGLNRYMTEYIDPIVSILSDPAYSSLRIVTVIEPDSLPNLITNLSEPACAEANSTGAYVQGIQYAVNQLHQFSNIYIYLDIAHSGWLGWSSNFGPAVQLYTQTIQGMNDGVNSIDGFITNTANYTPVEEPYLPDPNLNVGGQQVMAADFYEFNPYFDELDFATALRNSFISSGFPSGIGMLIDTSRNGWGGSERPTGASSSTDLNTYVNESRIDRRPHRGGWCNQAGAGIGARPQANPASGIDAFVWVKPPGESDGVSEPGIEDPDDPNKQFDAMCDPNAQNVYNTAYPTNALPNAPHAGRWFEAQFQMLLQNAYPPLQ